MPSINFVPDDYVQSSESKRANFMCLMLFTIVMAGLGGSFMMIKIREKACDARETLVNQKMTNMQDSIRKFEELQTKRKDMMRTALMTAELLEPVPRSVLLASLTNNLPPGVSLANLDMIQKEPQRQRTKVAPSNSYKTAQKSSTAGDAKSDPEDSPERRLETHLDIKGIAPSDLQVAAYIERLSNSILFQNVALVQSQEHKVEDSSFREFTLRAMLSKEVHINQKHVDEIRARAEKSIYQF